MRREQCWKTLSVLFAGLVILAIWWRRRRAERRRVPEAVIEFVVPVDKVEETRSPRVAETAAELAVVHDTALPLQVPPDDLTEIEGIGPKTRQVLAEAGIVTFAQLAATAVADLDQIVKQAGLRLAFPETWPEQAVLAERGDWAGLEALQNQLHRGRRV